MKKYKLFLDESGDFDTDLDPSSKRNPSLVGGFLIEEGLVNEKSITTLVEKVLEGKNHATELDATRKGLLVYEILTLAKNLDIEFVIFQNKEKQRIGNSTWTYLTVITEGIMQLTKYLVTKNAEAVQLSVVAGFKKDTTKPVTNSFVEGYIPLQDYLQRLNEKIIVEKTKLNNTNIQQSKISFQLQDDKRNSCLILCDYICNFWYTKPAKAYSVRVEAKDKTVRELLNPLYDPDMIFPLFCSEEREHVLRMLQDGTYADALFEYCAGTLLERNNNLIKESLLSLSDMQLNQQLSSLVDYIGIVFHSQKEFVEGARILERARELYEFLVQKNKECQRFYLDIQLYFLTYYNHMQKLDRMAEIFEEIEPQISVYTASTLDVEYFLIYFIRKAVYLQEIEDFAASYALCEKMEQMLELIEMSMLDTGCVTNTGFLHSKQLGKVLGTKLQALIGMCKKDFSLLDKAREVSDKAIRQFTYQEDLKRQYQYRAELEAVCKQFEEAGCWLEKSFGQKPWRLYLSSGTYDIYDIYNLLFVAAHNKEEHSEECREIVRFIKKNCFRFLEQDSAVADLCQQFIEEF